MTVPLVQGSIRYAYNIGEGGGRSQKNAAEGATFSAAVLPLVAGCDATAAQTISDNQKFGLYDAGNYGSFDAVKAAFESTYSCLGITCAQVGALKDSSTGALLSTKTAACSDVSVYRAPIAGYIPGSDVIEHNKIDLDQAAMETELGAANFAGATKWYADGGNSMKSSGSFRTIRGFSTGAQSKMYDGCPGCPYKHYKMFYDYYGDFDYADKWVSAALAGTSMTFSSGRHGPNDFSTLGNAARVEAVKKGSAYMNVWMYAIREFEDAIDDCLTCTSNCNEHSNDPSVHAWDEGVAFYTGSLEGTLGSSSGKLVYRLAEKRCANFGTCGPSGDAFTGTSYVNHELLMLFTEGERRLERGDCSAVRPLVNRIVSLMTVPLVQGSIRYAYNIGEGGSRSQKNAAEGATFSAAVLPLVASCDATAAQTISDNQKFGLYDAGVYGSFDAVKAAFEGTYSCLGITCAQVGALKDSSTGALLSTKTAACTGAAPYTPPPEDIVPGYQATTVYHASGSFTAHGDVSSISEDSKASIALSIATKLGVSVDTVRVTLESGSVLIRFYVEYPTKAEADSAVAALAPELSTPESTTTFFSTSNIQATSSPALSATAMTTFESTSDDLPNWAIAVIIATSVIAALLCFFISVMYQREKIGRPIFVMLSPPPPGTGSKTDKSVNYISGTASGDVSAV